MNEVGNTVNTVSSLILKQSDFNGLTSTITNNLNVLIPVGLTIMGIMVAVALIPRIIYKFLQINCFICPNRTF